MTQAPVKRTLPHFHELDGVRGCAALWIFWHHFLPATRHAATPGFAERAIRWVGNWGFLSVDVFFVLSGFLITSLLIMDRPGPHFFGNFYWKRVLRIQPAFCVFVALYFFQSPQSGKYLLLCVLFMANFAAHFHMHAKSIAWSLAIEEQFYFFWPQFVRRLSLRSLGWWALALVVGSAGLRIGVSQFWVGHGDPNNTLFRLDCLGLGALVACDRFAREQQAPALLRLIRWLRSPLALVLMIALSVYTAWLRHGDPRALASLCVGLLTYRLVAAVAEGYSITWLRWKPLTLMGGISYGFYLYHVFILEPIQGHWHVGFDHPGTLIAQCAVVFGGSVLMATVSLLVLERPVQRLRKYVLKRPHSTETSPLPIYVPEGA